MSKAWKKTLIIAIASSLLALIPKYGWSNNDPIEYSYEVEAEYPHSTTMFTQGLEIHQGLIYESSGLRGYSLIQLRPLHSIKPIQQLKLENEFFGEGITLFNNKIYQLTWKSKKGFVYQSNNLTRIESFTIDGQGWGITNNGKQLIYSDGSDILKFINPDDFSIEKTIHVTLNNFPVRRINELEWVDGVIYANIWQSEWIIMINPNTGNVIGRVDLKNLLPKELRSKKTDVLNGIAYDKATKQLYVTGKYWPRLYQIKLIPPQP